MTELNHTTLLFMKKLPINQIIVPKQIEILLDLKDIC